MLCTSILVSLSVSYLSVLPEAVEVLATVFPLPFLSSTDLVSSFPQAGEMLVKLPESVENEEMYRFLLLEPHPLLILQEQGMPALFHVQITTSHFFNPKCKTVRGEG